MVQRDRLTLAKIKDKPDRDLPEPEFTGYGCKDHKPQLHQLRVDLLELAYAPVFNPPPYQPQLCILRQYQRGRIKCCQLLQAKLSIPDFSTVSYFANNHVIDERRSHSLELVVLEPQSGCE